MQILTRKCSETDREYNHQQLTNQQTHPLIIPSGVCNNKNAHTEQCESLPPYSVCRRTMAQRYDLCYCEPTTSIFLRLNLTYVPEKLQLEYQSINQGLPK